MLGRAPQRWVGRVLLVAATGVALVTGSGKSEAAAGHYDVDLFVVTSVKKDQVRPRVSGSMIVWKDYRNAADRRVDDSPNAQIFGLDLSSGTELRVESKDSGDPAIFGTIVAWTAGGGKNNRVETVDLTDGHTFPAADPGRGNQERPAVSDSLIVWQDNRNGNWDIFARDLSQGNEIVVEAQSDAQLHPAVSGKIVVWEDYRDHGAGPDVLGRDLDDLRTFRLTNSHDAFDPAIWGRWVVWAGAVDQSIFARNLDDGKTKRLTKAPGAKRQPSISNGLVVWTDERNGDPDIYGYDLLTGTEFPVFVAPDPQDDPYIDGTTVVWSDARGPNRDIGGGKITLPKEAEAARATEAEAAKATVESSSTKSQPPAQPSVAAAPPGGLVPVPSAVERLRVFGTGGDGLNLRASPDPGAAVIKIEPEGTLLVTIGSPVQSGDYTWRNVRDPDGSVGWVATDYLTPA